MGAWTHEPFGNDTACDWISELTDTTDLSLIKHTLDEASSNTEYLEAPIAEKAVAAIEVIARILGKGTQNDIYAEAVDRWISKVKERPSNKLIRHAIIAARLVISERSELAELWHGQDEWFERMARLKTALESSLTSVQPTTIGSSTSLDQSKKGILNQHSNISIKHRTILSALENPINALKKRLPPTRKSIVAQHQKILDPIKNIQENHALAMKILYTSPDKLRGTSLSKVITLWARDIKQVSKEDLGNIEKNLGHGVRLPPSYQKNLLKSGIPVLSSEFLRRLAETISIDSSPPDSEYDYSILPGNILPLKRFLTPDEVIESTLHIAQKTNSQPTTIAVATDMDGNFLCFENCVKASPEAHRGVPDLVYDPKNDQFTKHRDFSENFGEWIDYYLLVKTLNLNEDSFRSLEAPINNMYQTINALLEEGAYKDNNRYHNAVEKVSNHILRLHHIYFQK